jgi:CRP-like cAMP-binding protein
MSNENFGELDDIGVLREAELFRSMPEPVIRTILMQAHSEYYPAGSWIVRKGEPGDSLFVVKSGVVEVLSPREGDESRPLAYLGRGDCLGELAILTDSPRHADVRVPEHAELIVIGRELFVDLLANHAGFASQLCVILAERLIKLLQDEPSAAGNKELQGNLSYFDLATVIQTLITSSQTGVMRLSAEGTTAGLLFFQNGNIAQASFQHRRGDEAIHQLFQVELAGEFVFSSSDASQEEDADPSITVPAMALVLDSVRLQDELAALRQKLPSDTTTLERADSQLEWSEEQGKKEAEAIWESLQTPKTLAEILDDCPGCHYHAAVVLDRLLETEQLMPALE